MLAELALRLSQPLISIGRFALLLVKASGSLRYFSTYRQNLFTQMVRIGIESLPIVALAAAFSGAVTTVQTAYLLVSPFIPDSIIGAVVVPSLILELGAVVTAFILAGRVGARIAAELGTMRVTEQIDALEAMGLNFRRIPDRATRTGRDIDVPHPVYISGHGRRCRWSGSWRTR